MAVVLVKREERNAIIQDSESLLVGYKLPALGESFSFMTEKCWLIVADIDQIQADLAGAETWEESQAGREWRDRIRSQLAQLSRDADQQDLAVIADRLVRLREKLQRYDLRP